jgi:hypothetical protein
MYVEDNKIHLKKITCDNVAWVCLVQDGAQLWAVMNMVVVSIFHIIQGIS